MNIDHDEFGPVNMDELTAIHHEKIQRRFEMESKKGKDEPTKNKVSKMSKCVGSQECVGDHKSRSKYRCPTDYTSEGLAYCLIRGMVMLLRHFSSAILAHGEFWLDPLAQ